MTTSVVSLALLLVSLLVCWANGEPIDVGSRKQLFVDKELIESSNNIHLTMNPPRKAGIAFEAEGPLENLQIGYPQVMEVDGAYRLYYSAYGWDPERERITYAQCVRTSRDGIKWERPKLRKIDGIGWTNSIGVGCDGAVFLDPKAEDGFRFKWFGRTKNPSIYGSEDGLTGWKSLYPAFSFGADSQNQAFYDEERNEYVAYLRGWTRNGIRTIVRGHTKELGKPWPFREIANPFMKAPNHELPMITDELPTVLAMDSDDPYATDLYNPSVTKYPWAKRVYLAFPSAYFHLPQYPLEKTPDRSEFSDEMAHRPGASGQLRWVNEAAIAKIPKNINLTYTAGPLDIQMAISRDGINWHRPYRAPYVRLGIETERDSNMLFMAVGMIRRGAYIYQYYAGFHTDHGDWTGQPREPGNVICRLVQRLDGFVSLDGDYKGGQFTTVPLRFDGSHLELNVDTSALGAVVVEIQDENGIPLHGFAANDCDIVYGNRIDMPVTWNQQSNLRSLSGRVVKLRFVMRGSKLYAFQFKKDKPSVER